MDFDIPISRLMSTKIVLANKGMTAYEACRLMETHQVSEVVVVEEKRPLGVFSEKEVLKNIILARQDPQHVAVSAVMSKDFFVEREGQSILQASLTMQEHDIKRLPVIDDDGSLVGILSESDIVHILAESFLFDSFSQSRLPKKK